MQKASQLAASSPAASEQPGCGTTSLRSRSFMLYMSGSFLSWAGDWLDLAALNWAVLEFTDSAFDLGLINACRLAPLFVLSVPAGMLADRFDRRRLLMILQAGMMLFTFAVGVLVAWRAAFGLFVLVVTGRALLSAMALPIRTALLSNLVPSAALPRAVAIQSAVTNISRTVGLAVAAILLSVLPLEDLFWINGGSFVLILLSLALVRPLRDQRPREAAEASVGLGEMLAFIRGHASIQSLLVLAIVPMTFGFPYLTMMPLFARDVFEVAEGGYGLLLTLAAAGALLGAVWLSLAGPFRRAGAALVLCIVGFGLSLIFFVSSFPFAMAAAWAVAVGLTSQLYRTMIRVTVQVQAPDHLRGRILSVALMDRGFIPLGTVLLGLIADWAGAFHTGLVMGAGCIAVTLLIVLLRPRIWCVEI